MLLHAINFADFTALQVYLKRHFYLKNEACLFRLRAHLHESTFGGTGAKTILVFLKRPDDLCEIFCQNILVLYLHPRI